MVQALVHGGADVNLKDNKNNDTAILKAAEANHLPVVKFLMENDAQLDATNLEGKTVFDFPITHELIMSILSDHIMEACRTGNMDMFQKYFLPQHMNINKLDALGATFVMYAAQFGNHTLLQFLVEHGADVHIRSKDGSSALLYASEAGHLAIVEFLVSRGAEINGQDKLGHTALMCAAYGGFLDIVKFLIEKGADINQQDSVSLSNQASSNV